MAHEDIGDVYLNVSEDTTFAAFIIVVAVRGDGDVLRMWMSDDDEEFVTASWAQKGHLDESAQYQWHANVL